LAISGHVFGCHTLGGCYWHLPSGGRGFRKTPWVPQDGPTTKDYQTRPEIAVPRSRNCGLGKLTCMCIKKINKKEKLVEMTMDSVFYCRN